MSVFGKLRAMVGWVLGEDLSAPATPQPRPEREAAPAKKVQRRADGDGFDARPAPRVTSTPRPEVSPLVEASRPTAPELADFAASLDDLHDLAGAAAEPEPEFIPEGGMSTQSLMREFELLDPELQATASELAARNAAEAAAADSSTQALLGEVDAVSTPPAEAAPADLQSVAQESSTHPSDGQGARAVSEPATPADGGAVVTTPLSPSEQSVGPESTAVPTTLAAPEPSAAGELVAPPTPAQTSSSVVAPESPTSAEPVAATPEVDALAAPEKPAS